MPAAPRDAEPSDSRAKILDVAEALFARRGYAGIGLREVAQRVGLGKSSLFHHFPTKRDLYHEVLARVLERLEVRLGPALRSDEGPARRLDLLIDAMVDALAEHPTTARLALRSLFEDDEMRVADPASRSSDRAGRSGDADPVGPLPYEATLARLIVGFQRLVAEGVASGEFRDVSPGHLTQTLIGATVYHFASAELGDEILGAPIFSADQVGERKRQLKSLVRNGIKRGGSDRLGTLTTTRLPDVAGP